MAGATLLPRIFSDMHDHHAVASDKRLAVGALLCTILLAANFTSFGQERPPTSRKIDEFEGLNTDDVMARLDYFATELGKEPIMRGFIVSFRSASFPPGSRLREIYGYQDYLVDKRGIAPDRVTVIDGGVNDKSTVQLWLGATGADLPAMSAAHYTLNAPLHFDSVSLGNGCVGEFTVMLEEPSDALRFFAGALQENLDAKGFVLVHPSSRRPLRNPAKLVTISKTSLIKESHIAANRIITQVESPRHCAEIELWLAPLSLTIPKYTSPSFHFQSQLMAEAEDKQYSVRRVELLGNTYTRDNVIRRRILQNEGDIFRRKLLEQSLRNISKLRNFSPVRIHDVEVNLDREDKTIDFQIYLNERTRSLKH